MSDNVYEYDDLPEPSYDGKYREVTVALIKYITARVRKTIEYKNYIEYLKKTMDVNKCSFYKDYSMENGYTIEMHHHPLSLFDIVETVCKKYTTLTEKCPGGSFVRPWEIEEEVNILHYDFFVGLTPLSPTAHKLVHSGRLKIHPRMVIGNWGKFIKEYKPYISEAVNGKIEEFKIMAKTNPDTIPELMKYKPILINNTNYKSLGSLNIQDLIINKLKTKYLIDKG